MRDPYFFDDCDILTGLPHRQGRPDHLRHPADGLHGPHHRPYLIRHQLPKTRCPAPRRAVGSGVFSAPARGKPRLGPHSGKKEGPKGAFLFGAPAGKSPAGASLFVFSEQTEEQLTSAPPWRRLPPASSSAPRRRQWRQPL